MKKVFLLLTVFLLGSIFVATGAQAYTLVGESFSPPTTVILNANNGIKTDTDLGKWIDFPQVPSRWGIGSGGGNYFAQHFVQTSDNTNILMYGIDATSLLPGTELVLDFNYLASRTGSAYIVGMDLGYHFLDNNGPWLDAETSTNISAGQERLGTDGVVLAKYTLNTASGNLADVSTWSHFTSPTLTWTGSGVGWNVNTNTNQTFNFDTLAIAFVMGGSSGNRALDNVNLQGTAPVPEPATMLLLASGLVGLAGMRRKFKR